MLLLIPVMFSACVYTALIQGILRDEWGCEGWFISDHVHTNMITSDGGLTGGLSAFDASLPVILNFRQYENDPYMRTLMREACHRGLYALVNSSAMNGVGPDTQIIKVTFWLVKVMAALAIVCWGLSAYCALRWYRRRKEWAAHH